MDSYDPPAHDPLIMNLDEGIGQISEHPICDFCTKPEDVINGDPTRIVAFNTYSELKEHRRAKHARVDKYNPNYQPTIEFQLSTTSISYDEESEIHFVNAERVDIELWVVDLKKYLNILPEKRSSVLVGSNTRNLRPINEG